MRTSRNNARRRLATLTAAVYCGVGLLNPGIPHANATAYYWDTTATGLWSTGANWSTSATGSPAGAIAPSNSTTADTATFNGSAVTGDEIVQLNVATSITGITFANAGSTTTIESSSSTPQNLTIGASGIAINSGTGVTIGDATNHTTLTLASNETWTNNSAGLFTAVDGVTNGGNTLTIAGTGNTTLGGIISGTGGLTLSGTGTVILGASNTYSGITSVGSGTLSVSVLGLNGETSSSVGAASGTTNRTIILDATGNGSGVLTYTGATTTTDHNFSLGGTGFGTGTLNSSGSGKLTLTGAIDTGTHTFTFGGTQLGEAQGVISDSGPVKIASSGSGAWYFSALNTYINATTIVSGTLQINTIRNANTAGGSSLGNPNVANSVIAIDAGGTLQYTGSTLGSSNRVINMASAAGGTFTLDASGSATFALSGGVTTAGTGAHTSTLVLTGTGAGSESGTIVNGASSNITALTKSGGGTWTLIGTKTYSGATTIQGGTLALSATANNVPNSSKIIVGDTSVGSAILDVTSITTGFKVAAGQVIAGNGTVSGNLTLTSDTAPATGAIISAGSGNTSSDTVGSLILSGAANAFGTGSTGTQVTYDWKLANAATAAGAGYDTLAVTGLSVGNVVDVVPIALSTAAGSFDSSTNYTWDIVSGTGAGTLAGKFQLDTSGLSSFASTLGVSPSSFSIVDDMGTGDVAIQYSGAPEPTSMMLLTVGLAGVAVLRRRRVAVKDKSSNGCKVQNELSQMR